MDKLVTAVLVGAGNRADVYAKTSLSHPERLRIVGIVDPDPVRLGLMKTKYSVPEENCFSDVSALVRRGRIADAVINGTMDHLHVPTSIPVLEAGYDLLVEKPFAVNETEMEAFACAARAHGRRVVVGHVLRYTDFYRELKARVSSGEIGRIISVEMCEHVNYHHMAVSYVRGKWRSEKLCFAPMLLAKSCHDIDIMLWMMSETEPSAVASFGGDFQFGRERKPEGAAERCMAGCPFVDDCIFSAKANYLAAVRWSQYVWKCLEGEGELTDELKARSLATDNPYGRCVWDFERDGNVDHQNVTVRFKNGAVGSFTMTGGSAKSERNIHLVGTKGEIKGTFEDSRYVVRKMDPPTRAGYTETEYFVGENGGGDKIGASGGHGNGDENLVLDFLDYVNGGEPSPSCATLEDSIKSHRLVFAAGRALKSGEVVRL